AEHVAQLVLDRERIHQRQLGGAGIAEQDLDPLLLEELQERTLSRHHGHGSPPVCRGGSGGVGSLYAVAAAHGQCQRAIAAAQSGSGRWVSTTSVESESASAPISEMAVPRYTLPPNTS